MPWIHSLVDVKTFYRVLWKVAGNCMKNGNKSPNMTYSAMVWRVEKWSGTHIDDRITTKRLFIVPTGSPIRTSSFNEIMCISFALTCRQTHRQTHKQDWIHNLLQPSLAEITQHNTTQHNTTNSGDYQYHTVTNQRQTDEHLTGHSAVLILSIRRRQSAKVGRKMINGRQTKK